MSLASDILQPAAGAQPARAGRPALTGTQRCCHAESVHGGAAETCGCLTLNTTVCSDNSQQSGPSYRNRQRG